MQVLSCLICSCLVLSLSCRCLVVVLSCLVLSCVVLSSLVFPLSCLLLSCLVLSSCFLSCLVFSWSFLVLSCLVDVMHLNQGVVLFRGCRALPLLCLALIRPVVSCLDVFVGLVLSCLFADFTFPIDKIQMTTHLSILHCQTSFRYD